MKRDSKYVLIYVSMLIPVNEDVMVNLTLDKGTLIEGLACETID